MNTQQIAVDPEIHSGTPIASPAIYATALRLSLRYEHRFFDTLYHAMALDRDDAQLMTADARYHKKTKTEGQIMLLANLSFA